MLPARTDAPAALEIKILDGMMSDNPTSWLCGLSWLWHRPNIMTAARKRA